MKAADWIDRVKTAKGLTSDYSVANALGLSRATVSKYRSTTPTLDEDTALKVAHALSIDVAIVLADQSMERSKDQEARSAWATILERLGGVAASIFLASGLVGGLAASPDAQSAERSQTDSKTTASDIYIV